MILPLATHPVVRDEARRSARDIGVMMYGDAWSAESPESILMEAAIVLMLIDLNRAAGRDWWVRWALARLDAITTARREPLADATTRAALSADWAAFSEHANETRRWLDIRDNPEALAAEIMASFNG